MSERTAITKDQYFANLNPVLGTDVRPVIDAIIEWAHQNDLEEYFSTGERGPAFTPRIHRAVKPTNPVSVQADGWIVIPIRWMGIQTPFSDPAICQELIDRIKDIPGAVITEKGNEGFPKIPAASLTSPDQLSNFIETLDWIVEVIATAEGVKPAGRRIIVYGHGDESELGFRTWEDFIRYIKGSVFSTEGGRYRQTQRKNADIIVLSKDGKAAGHFVVDERIDPTDADREAYPPVKAVYPVRKAVCYAKGVRLSEIPITGIQFGRRISEDQFRKILDLAEEIEESFDPSVDGPSAAEIATTTTKVVETDYFSPGSLTDERERRLREIVERRGQPEFRSKLIAAYGSRCAVTGCDAPAALEAAHIVPYTGPQSNHVTNGLLLRADIHTLFDLNLIGIDPDELTISVAPTIQATVYAELQGRKLYQPVNSHEAPNQEALTQRWKKFSGPIDP
ncbi:MAG: HNH endonuclease signature motif containing protein [Planctomycetaceae bacterium]